MSPKRLAEELRRPIPVGRVLSPSGALLFFAVTLGLMRMSQPNYKGFWATQIFVFIFVFGLLITAFYIMHLKGLLRPEETSENEE